MGQQEKTFEQVYQLKQLNTLIQNLTWKQTEDILQEYAQRGFDIEQVNSNDEYREFMEEMYSKYFTEIK